MLCFFCDKDSGNKKYCDKQCKKQFENRKKSRAKSCKCGAKIHQTSITCIKCKPASHKKDPNIEYTCNNCGKIYKFSQKKNGATTKLCSSCQVNIRKHKNKLQAIDYKGGCCQKCGYNKCIRALCFHHIDPTKKEFGVSGNHCRAWQKVKQELDKCLLLCHNCHMELHDELEGVVTSNQNKVHPDGIAPSNHGNLP